MSRRGLATDEAQAEFLRALGRRLRLFRLLRELSQEELAAVSGMSRSFVSIIEHGAHGVDVVRLFRLAAALDVSLLTLLDVGSPPAPGANRSEGLPS